MKYDISNYTGIFRIANLFYKPLYITVDLTFRCNLKCGFCGVFGRNPKADEEYQDMPFFIFQRILQKFSGALTIALGGGEPFLHKDIFKMIKYGRKFKMRIAIDTNGTLLNDIIDQIISAVPNSLTISLNACNENEYRKINNAKKGVFEEVLKNIEKLIEERKKERTDIKLGVSYVCTKHNYREIPHMVELAQDLNVDRVFFRNLVAVPKDDFTEDYSLFEEDEDVMDVINNLNKAKCHIEVVGPNLLSKKLLKRKIYCLQPFTWISINPKGDISPCCNDLIRCGNILDGNIVWNNDIFLKIRRLMISGESSLIPNLCKICPIGLYSRSRLPSIGSYQY